MSIETYLFSSPLLSYSCPSQTPPSAEWKSLDLAPEISAHAGETSSGNTKIQVKGTQGVECEVVFEGWKGSEGWINGWTNPNSSTWCCSLDESKDWTCFRDDGKEDFDSTTLCVYSGLDPEQEHSIKVKNSPEGRSRLLIDSAFSNGRKGDEIKTTDINTRVSTAEPGTVDLKTYYTTSTTSSSSFPSPSSSSSTSSNPPSSSSLPESSTSSSAPSATSTPGASSSSTGLFLVVALGILTIVVVCIIAILFLRTKPKSGRESNGLLMSRSKKERKRVKKRVEKVLDQGSSDTEDEGDLEKGSTKKSQKKKKKGKYRDDDDRAETSTGGSEDEKTTSRRWSKRRDEDVDTLIGEETTDDEEAGTSDEELREKKSEFFFEIFSSFNRSAKR
ncbi:hypothetical protein JCM5353_004526 [Sporobolomyces roseus]